MAPATAPVAASPKKKGRSEWEDTFPADIKTVPDSVIFMNRCLYVTFAHILESRGLMPKECFKKRNVGDLVKTYIMELRHPLGLRMANKFRGAGKAIELGYLKEFMVVVSQNEENPDDAIEVFTWKMVYGEDGYVMAQFTDGDQKVLATLRYQGMEKVKEQTRALLMLVRRLCRNILEPLPSDAFATLRVTYTDKTPKGYQAEGFYRSETLYDLSPDAKEVILGGVASAHHRCILSAKSVYVEDEYTVQERLNGSDEYSDGSLNNSFTGAEDLDQSAQADPEPKEKVVAEKSPVVTDNSEESNESEAAVNTGDAGLSSDSSTTRRGRRLAHGRKNQKEEAPVAVVQRKRRGREAQVVEEEPVAKKTPIAHRRQTPGRTAKASEMTPGSSPNRQ